MHRKLGLWVALGISAVTANPVLAQPRGRGSAPDEEAPPAATGALDDERPPGALDDERPPTDDEAPPSDEPALLSDEQADMREQQPVETVRASTDPHEEENTDYFFLGGFYRHVIIPGFVQSLFVDGGIDGSNPGFGLEFNWRRNNFNVVASLWWNNASADGFFRASGDPRTDTEYVDVDLWVIFVNAAFLWAFPITDWFAIELGFDLGFGFVGGSLVRTEAYESSPGRGDFTPCEGPGDPRDPGGYCEPPAPNPCYANDGGHYGCSEPNWFTGSGDTPFLMPWIALPHLAVRFKPIRQLQIRVDGGYGIYNFFFGASASYGF